MSKPRCTCPETQEFNGKLYPLVLDPECSAHAFPRDRWRKHPLQGHTWKVDRTTSMAYPEHVAKALVMVDGRVDFAAYGWRFRDETPRETTARLIAELRG